MRGLFGRRMMARCAVRGGGAGGFSFGVGVDAEESCGARGCVGCGDADGVGCGGHGFGGAAGCAVCGDGAENLGQYRGGSAQSGLSFEDANGTLRFVTNLPCGSVPTVALEIRRSGDY